MSKFTGRGLTQLTGKQRRNIMSNTNIYSIGTNPYTAQSHITVTGSQPTGIGALTSSQLNTLTTINLSNLNASLSGLEVNSYIKKYEIVETIEDLLVLSCAWYRMRQERNKSQTLNNPMIFRSMPDKLLDKVLFENVEAEDKELAANIRDYYSKKIMMLKLKDIKLTKYREELNQFIHSDGKKFQESICGLAYRLPEFYYHDKKFEEITIGCNREIKKTIPSESHRLTHLGTMKVDRKTSKRIEYWFRNENYNLFNIILEPNNPLLKIWDRIILEEINVQGKYYIKKRDDFEYFSIQNYSIV